MKRITLIALCWPLFQLFSGPLYAQKSKSKNEEREIIVIKNGDKERKLTIETKDGQVFINGKPSSEYKDGDVSVIKNKFKNGDDFVFAPGANSFNLSSTWDNEKSSFLGVTTEKTDDGAKITNVSKGSAAEKAGLKEGDIITKVEGKKVSDPDDLMEAVSAHKAKEDVTVHYKRDGKNEETKATLQERNRVRAFTFNGSGGNSNRMKNFDFVMPSTPHAPMIMNWSGFGRPRLGVSIEDTENDTGAKVTGVNDDSPAAKSGLKQNDIITEVNGNGVKSVNDLRKEIADVKDKNSYNIKAKRNGADMNFEIKIPKKLNKADL